MSDAEIQALLEQLRDVHVPAEPGLWPLAPGWWVATGALLLVALLCVAGYRLWKHSVRQTWKKLALKEHARLAALPLAQPEQLTEVVAGVSALLRRVALAVCSRETAASLTDEDWLQRLDQLRGSSEFTSGDGQLLQRQPYQRPGTVDQQQVERLLLLAQKTIQALPDKGFDPRTGAPETPVSDASVGAQHVRV